MAIQHKIALIRGPKANLGNYTPGTPGILVYCTDSAELFVDNGTALVNFANNMAVFNVANPAALTALAAKIGDLGVSASDGKTYILTGFPASTSGNWVVIATSNAGAPVQGLASGIASEWVSYIDAAGVQHLTQPTFADLLGTLSASQLPAVIDCGTL